MNNLNQLKQKALQLLEESLAEQKDISGAHSKSHLTMAANLTQLVGKIYSFSDKELFLSYFAALFHDIIRSTAEDVQNDDEKLSAKMAVSLLEQFSPTEQEREAIFFAIENHGYPSSWMNREASLPESLKEKVRFALFVADKMEQNGVRVIARRSAFVAGERLHKTNGDLKDFGFKANLDEALVVTLESILRLTFINPEDIDPKRLSPIIKPLYKIQRQFLFGIMKALNLSVEKISEKLIQTRRSDGKNLLQVRDIKIDDQDELIDLIESKGRVTDKEVRLTSRDIAQASLEAVKYFSEHYESDIDQLMLDWKVKNEIAKNWQQEMVEYLNGTWFNQVEKLI